VCVARSGRRDGGGGGRGGGGRGGGSRGGGRGGSGGGRIGSMGGGGSARPSHPSAMRSVVGSYTIPPPPSSAFSHGAHY